MAHKKHLIVKGEDAHTYRLEQSLSQCGQEFQTVEKYEEIPEERVDLAFIDPSLSYDPSPKVNADLMVFYDCEDSPTDYKLGTAYDLLKDSILYYCKMNWMGDTFGKLKLIGFPPAALVSLAKSDIATVDVPPFTHEHAIPFFVGTGTFLGTHTPVKDGVYNNDSILDVSSLGKYEDHYMYNQRIDWLLSLRKNNIPHVGGLAFTESNLSLEWQSKYFGKGVAALRTSPMNRQQFFNSLFGYRIGLNPTGHDRNSWRIYDLMAAGSVLITTDMKHNALYMPKEMVVVKDGEDLGKKLLSIQPDYYHIWEACQENRKIVAEITPEKAWKDFMGQIV